MIALPPKLVERSSNFTGRTWLLDLVLDWADHGSERFLMIRGQPGSGKSACAAWLCGAGPAPAEEAKRDKLERVRRLWHAAHFCDARSADTVNPSGFSRKISGQLAECFHEFQLLQLKNDPAVDIHVTQTARNVAGDMVAIHMDHPAFGSVPQDIYQKTVARPLEELAKIRPNVKVFVLVDSLDEANTFQIPNIVTLLADSAGMNTNVRFLVTSRQDPRIVPRFSNSARIIDLSTGQWRAETDSDIRKYVSARIAEPPIAARIPQAIRPEAVTEELVKIANGNFLYVSFLLNEVGNNRTLDDLDTLPSDLYGLYRDYLDRLMPDQTGSAPRTPRSDSIRKALGALSAAMAAISAETLAHWLRTDMDETTSILLDLSQIVTLNADGYRLYHRSLADFFDTPVYSDHDQKVQNVYAIQLLDHHKRIADYYLQGFLGRWEECDRYGLRHLSAHLRELAAGSEYRNQLYALIGERVMAAKLLRTGSHQAFGGDVGMAMGVAEAEQPLNVEQMVKCSLVAAELNSRARSVPAAALGVLASLGRVGEAIDRARLIPEEGARFVAMTDIAEVLLADGPLEEVYSLLEPIVRSDASPAVTGRARLIFISALVRLKNLDEARAIASKAGTDPARQSAIGHLLKELTDAGSYDEAARTMDLLPPHGQMQARQTLVKRRAEGGDLAAALRSAIGLGQWEVVEVMAIADSQQGFEKAVALARESKVDGTAFSAWAAHLGKIGRLQDALSAARVGGGQDAIDSAWAAWAAKLAGDGALDDALDNTLNIKDKWKRDQACKVVALAAARLDRFEDAFQTVNRIDDSWARRRAAGELLRLESDLHGPDAALNRAATVEPEQDRSEALVVFGLSLFESGPTDVARGTAARLPVDSRNRLLRGWVDIALKAGRFREAWNDAVTDFSWRSTVMKNVLEQAVAVGQFDLALELVASLSETFERFDMLASALEFQMEREPIDALITRIDATERMMVVNFLTNSLRYKRRFDQAVTVASAIPDRRERDLLLRQIVSACIEERRLDSAILAAHSILGPDTMAAEIAGVARQLAETGKLERATELAREALSLLTDSADPEAHVSAWSAAAETLARAGDAAAAVKLVIQARGLASALGNSSYDAVARVAFTRALVSVGRTEEAMQSAMDSAEPAVRTAALAGVVYCLAPSGGPEMERAVAATLEAMRAEDRVGLPDPLRTLLAGLAIARRFDLVPAALATAVPYRRLDAVTRAAWARIEAGDIDGAVALAGILDIWPDRVNLFLDVASEMASRGQAGTVTRLGAEAIELTNAAAPGSGWRGTSLQRVAELCAQVRAVEPMWAAIDAMEESQRSRIAGAMIPLLIRSGQDAVAASMLSRFPDQFAVVEAMISSITELLSGNAVERAAGIAAVLASNPNQKDHGRKAWQCFVVALVKSGGVATAVEQLRSHADSALCQNVLREAASELSGPFSDLAETLLFYLDRGREKDGVIQKVAAGLAHSRQFEPAVRVAAGMQLVYSRAKSLAAILRYALDDADLDTAVRLAGSVADKGARSRALVELAAGLTKDHRFIEAETLAAGAEVTAELDYEYAIVVKGLAAGGEFERALRFAARVPESRRGSLLESIAESAAAAGKLDLALGIVEGLSWRRNNGLAALVLAVAGKGDFDGAVKLTERIDQSAHRAGSRAALARLALRTGHRQLAELLVGQVLDSVETAHTGADTYAIPLHDLAVALARVGQPELAARITADIDTGSWLRPDALRAGAQAWMNAKDNQRAVAAALDAWSAGLKITDPQARAAQGGQTVAQLIGWGAFEDLATLLGRVETAKSPEVTALFTAVVAYRIAAAASKGPDAAGAVLVRARRWARRWRLRRIAVRLAGSAHGTASEVDDAARRGKVLAWVALAYSQAGRARALKEITREALEAAERISQPPDRVWVFCQLAVAWRQIDRRVSRDLFERVLTYTDELNANQRSGLYALYQNLPDSGDRGLVERAVKLLEGCDASSQARLLSTMVRALVQSDQVALALTMAPRLLDLGEMVPDNPYLCKTRPNMQNAIEAIAAISDGELMKALVQNIRGIEDVAERARLGASAAAILAPLWRSEILIMLLNDVAGWLGGQSDPQLRAAGFTKLAAAFAAAGECGRAIEMFQQAIGAARLAGAPVVVQSLVGVLPCLAGGDELKGICNAVLEVRRWWPERSQRASG